MRPCFAVHIHFKIELLGAYLIKNSKNQNRLKNGWGDGTLTSAIIIMRKCNDRQYMGLWSNAGGLCTYLTPCTRIYQDVSL